VREILGHPFSEVFTPAQMSCSLEEGALMHSLVRNPVIVLLLPLLLAACSMPVVNIQPQDGHGYVVMSFRPNSPGLSVVGAFHDYRYYDVIVVQRLDAPANQQSYFELERWGAGVAGEAIYMGTVPEGRYRLIRGFARTGDGNVSHFIRVPVHRNLGEFEVFDNSITDIGTLTASHTILDDEWVSLFARLPIERDLSFYVRRYLEDTEQVLPMDGKVGWLGGLETTYNLGSIEYARRNPIVTGPALVDSVDRMVLPTAFGDLLVRSPDGDWQRVSTGSSGALWSVAESDDGFYLAGALGTVLWNVDLYADGWAEVSGFSSHSDVINLSFHEGELYATVIDREVGLTTYQVLPSGSMVTNFYPNPTLVLYRLNRVDMEWESVADYWMPVQLQNLRAENVGQNVLLVWESELAQQEGLIRVNLSDYSMESLLPGTRIASWEIGPYDETSFVSVRPVRIGIGSRAVISSIKDGESKGSSEERSLRGIQHKSVPIKLADGRVVAFGTRTIGWDRNERIYKQLEGATVEADGEEVPYDPEDGTYFVSDAEGGWVPFAIPPRPCFGLQPMIAVRDKIVQRCRFGPTHSVRVGDSDWVEEDSTTAMQTVESE
jgi:hypothetical protein